MFKILRVFIAGAACGGLIISASPAAERSQQFAQAQPQPRPVPAQPARPAGAAQAQTAPAPAPAAAPAAPQQPTRTEVLNFDNWSVTCQEFGDPQPRRNCAATLSVQQQGTTNIVLAWNVTAPDKTRLISVMQLPTGVMIAPGIDVSVGKAAARKFGYARCDQQRCEAVVTLDEAMVRDTAAAEAAQVVMQSSNGQTITFSFPMKGFDKALAALRK